MAVPSVPQGVVATAGAGPGKINQRSFAPQGEIKGVAIVTWTPPADGAVVDYLVTASPGGATRTVSGFPWRAVFWGLTVGTQYTFDVVARNGDGNSDAATSNAVVPRWGPGWMSQTFYALVAQLASDGVNANVQFGGEFKPENDSPPKVVWQPDRGQFSQTAFQAPRQIRTRSVSFPVLCWARATPSDPKDVQHDDIANYDAAEALMNSVVASLNRVSFGGDVIRAEQWPQQNAATTTFGAAVILGVELKFPVVDYAPTTATIKEIDNTTTLDQA